MAAEPSRRHFKGPAVKKLRGMTIVSDSRPPRFGSSRVRVALGAGASIAAVLAMTIGLPALTRSNRAAAAAAPLVRVAPQNAAVPAAHPTLAGQPNEPDVQRFTGLVGSDLSKALVTAGVPQEQGREYVALLARAIPLADGLSVDDRFDLVLERHDDGSFGQLLYAGMDRVARADVELLKWTDGKHVIWVNADGVGGESSAGMRMPVNGHLTSSFGERFHPILGYERFHAGVDLGAAAGTPIVAAADGRVVSAGWRGGYGQAVEIAHGAGLDTLYGHMSRIAASAGEAVHRGEVIGYVGSTGLSTGPHLHFEVTRNGRPVNPLTVKLASGPGQLEGAKLVAFHNELRALLLGRS
jgi:murein DD-endopeptidase MepM/ murein hydrolase activator NlpD